MIRAGVGESYEQTGMEAKELHLRLWGGRVAWPQHIIISTSVVMVSFGEGSSRCRSSASNNKPEIKIGVKWIVEKYLFPVCAGLQWYVRHAKDPESGDVPGIFSRTSTPK